MFVEPLLFLIPLVLFGVLLWTHVDKIYRLHYSTRKNYPFLFKITGFNEKYIEDPELWIKRFRIYLILFSIFFIGIVAYMVFRV